MALISLGAKATTIEFSAPVDEERETGSYTLHLSADDAKYADLAVRLDRFMAELRR